MKRPAAAIKKRPAAIKKRPARRRDRDQYQVDRRAAEKKSKQNRKDRNARHRQKKRELIALEARVADNEAGTTLAIQSGLRAHARCSVLEGHTASIQANTELALTEARAAKSSAQRAEDLVRKYLETEDADIHP